MSKVTNNENMRRYVHIALSKQASGSGLSPQDIQEFIDAAIPQWVKKVPIITEDISSGPVEITSQRFATLCNSSVIVSNDSIYTIVADHDIAMSIVENTIRDIDDVAFACAFLLQIGHSTDSSEPVSQYSAIYIYESSTTPAKFYIERSEY